MTSPVDRLPGMECAAVGHDAGYFDAQRLGVNDWALVGSPDPADRAAVKATAAHSFRPSASLKPLAAASPDAQAVLARIELDKCGAWITLATTGHARPIVVRRAGWIDVRGHRNPLDDRVGLGPGDSIVFVTDPLADVADDAGERFGDETMLEGLLDCAGAPADTLAAHVVDAASRHAAAQPLPDNAVALVARVPEEPGRDPLERMVEATGVPIDELVALLPGYPLGDEQPDLWNRPPLPPREARIRLAPVVASAPRMRELLRRLQSSWRMPNATDGVLELLATEMAANAIKHARSDMTVIVRYLGNVIRVEVGDGSREMPQPRQAQDEDMDGRGLALIDALAQDWGVLPTRTGKRVWCDVAVDTGS